MKKLSIVLAMVLIMATGCHKKKTGIENPILVILDTVYGPDTPLVGNKETVITTDSFLVWVSNRFDSLESIIQEQKSTIRSRDSALFEARFKLARVWYYDSLCLKNSRLDKYLKGWIRRALEK